VENNHREKGAMAESCEVKFVVTAKARAAVRLPKGNAPQEAIGSARASSTGAGDLWPASLERGVDGKVERGRLELGLPRRRRALEKVGLGERLAPMVAAVVCPPRASEESSPAARAAREPGTEGLLVAYARCASRSPTIPSSQFLSAGRGVVVIAQTA